MTTTDDARPTDDEWAVPDEPDLPEPPEWEPPEDATPEGVARAGDETWFDDATRALARVTKRLKRLDARAQRMLDQVHADAAAKEAAITEWATRKRTSDANRLAFLKDAISRYVLDVRTQTEGRVKSMETPWAYVGTGLKGGKWTASAEALEWARTACPNAVKREETLLVSELQRLPGARVEGDRVMLPGGEVIPGITVEPKRVEATVRVVEDVP